MLESVDRKSTRLNSSHANISYAVFCLKKKKLMKTTIWEKFYAETPLYKVRCQNASAHLLSGYVEKGKINGKTALDFCFFFLNDRATTEIHPFSLHDALPI